MSLQEDWGKTMKAKRWEVKRKTETVRDIEWEEGQGDKRQSEEWKIIVNQL